MQLSNTVSTSHPIMRYHCVQEKLEQRSLEEIWVLNMHSKHEFATNQNGISGYPFAKQG